nr:rhodopsin-like [Penaeus vannamei]
MKKIIYNYTFIVKTAHEKGMREQAKKMGVKSLRSEEAQKTSAECRLCKVALMTVTLWFMAWTPYFVINWGGMFNKPMVTPLFSIWGSVFAKANAVYNPIVYAISIDLCFVFLLHLPKKCIAGKVYIPLNYVWILKTLPSTVNFAQSTVRRSDSVEGSELNVVLTRKKFFGSVNLHQDV